MNYSKKKNILLGVCGIGNGHINRQRLIIKELLNYNINLLVAGPENAINIFKNVYPSINMLSVYVPWISCDNLGVNFEDTLRRYNSAGMDYYKEFLEFSIKVKSYFNSEEIDLFFTDYEPNVAQLSYAMNKPLICLDQHSKFLILPDEFIGDYSINVEISRLKYFFPYAQKRYVSSFFQMSGCNQYNIEIIPPIIKNIAKKPTIPTKGLVYFSTYNDNKDDYYRVLNTLKNMSVYTFYIFSKLDFSEFYDYPNLVFKEIGDEFNEHLADSCFIISTAGHQLICEAIYLEIPMYTWPLNTYDQNFCCYMVEKYHLGKKMHAMDENEFTDFLNNIDFYKASIRQFKNENWSLKWNEVLFSKLEKEFSLIKKEDVL